MPNTHDDLTFKNTIYFQESLTFSWSSSSSINSLQITMNTFISDCKGGKSIITVAMLCDPLS